MVRRLISITVVAVLAFTLAACHNKKVSNPIASVDSKQPDKVLFDRAMDMLKHNKFDQARLTLETLINTYPDSEFIARAKLGVADSWYAEGGNAAWAQAEAQYDDFRTFFPNMPEAAEAQMKVGNIHYQQMEKPDRDFTHAKRAEDAYRQMILQYPDSKLLPQAKERLRQVQEVLAEREFRIGRFYYLRESYPAAIARLQSVADTYPLYSGAEEALYMIGDAYEGEIRMLRLNKGIKDEVTKGKLIKEWTDSAANAYQRIITRYPVTGRADDAKKRLTELKRPIPTPTPEAIAQNKAEEQSRKELGMWARAMLNFHKRPDMAAATKVGEPSLIDPQQSDAPHMLRHVNDVIMGSDKGTGALSVEKVGNGAPGPNQPVPRSDQPNAPAPDQSKSTPDGSGATTTNAATTGSGAGATQTGTSSDQSPAATGIGELSPMNAAPGTTANQTTPPQTNPGASDQTGSTPAPPPAQVNEINNNGTSTPTATTGTQDPNATQTDDKNKKESSSKKKKKKLVIF